MCFGCSKEPSHWEGSFEYPQHMFWLRNKKNNFQICAWSTLFAPGFPTQQQISHPTISLNCFIKHTNSNSEDVDLVNEAIPNLISEPALTFNDKHMPVAEYMEPSVSGVRSKELTWPVEKVMMTMMMMMMMMIMMMMMMLVLMMIIYMIDDDDVCSRVLDHTRQFIQVGGRDWTAHVMMVIRC